MAKDELKSKIANSLVFMGRGTNEIIVYLPVVLRFWEAKRWGLENYILYVKQPSI